MADARQQRSSQLSLLILPSSASHTMAPLESPHDLIGQSSLYNHPDPLLRRLRLDDSSGGSITDLDKAFKGKEVVVLYAGSEHGSSAFLSRPLELGTLLMIDNLKSFHRVCDGLDHLA